MTFLDFIQFACAAIFVTYMIAINQFKKEDKRDVGGRPQPEDYTFFPRQGRGLDKKEIQRMFGPPAEKTADPQSTGATVDSSGKTIPAAKQRKLNRDEARRGAAKNDSP